MTCSGSASPRLTSASERTVHRHVAKIFTKLDVDSRTMAVTYAIKHRLIEVGML
ncbi:LuxR C-terminal-related transcriptional regulator [Ruania alba]|uniref:LuxR C-terminal-related transcriptional regulator n=1 Tax=Ruania alba TaxID=648782 RepID=UPI000B7D42D3